MVFYKKKTFRPHRRPVRHSRRRVMRSRRVVRPTRMLVNHSRSIIANRYKTKMVYSEAYNSTTSVD